MSKFIDDFIKIIKPNKKKIIFISLLLSIYYIIPILILNYTCLADYIILYYIFLIPIFIFSFSIIYYCQSKRGIETIFWVMICSLLYPVLCSLVLIIISAFGIILTYLFKQKSKKKIVIFILFIIISIILCLLIIYLLELKEIRKYPPGIYRNGDSSMYLNSD